MRNEPAQAIPQNREQIHSKWQEAADGLSAIGRVRTVQKQSRAKLNTEAISPHKTVSTPHVARSRHFRPEPKQDSECCRKDGISANHSSAKRFSSGPRSSDSVLSQAVNDSQSIRNVQRNLENFSIVSDLTLHLQSPAKTSPKSTIINKTGN